MELQKEVNTLLSEFENSKAILNAIGDQVRQHIIISILSNHQKEENTCTGMRVGEIAALTNLSRPAISHHIKILKEAGILKVRSEGKKNYYYFDTDTHAIDQLIDMLNRVKEIMAILPDRSGEYD